jgi:phosphoribosylformylglycinamidine synthase subunit PurL
VVAGMSEACTALGIPVVGGNVSFYNESRGENIHPTPVVGVVGLIDDLQSPPPPPALRDGDEIVLLGRTLGELGGSEWAAVVHGFAGGRAPAADLEAAATLHPLVSGLVRRGAVGGIHDCSDGGLAVTLAEMSIRGGVGFLLDLADTGTGFGAARELFCESANRVVVSVAPEHLDDVLASARAAGVPATRLGRASGDRLAARPGFDVALAEAAEAWTTAIPRRMAAAG